MIIRVALNGTDVNPYHGFGLTANPFPQFGDKQLDTADINLRKLAADPIPHNGYEEYIRSVLQGWSEEFIQLCIKQFEPGKYVRFSVEWKGDVQ